MGQVFRRSLHRLAAVSLLPCVAAWASGCLYAPATVEERTTAVDSFGGAGSDRPFRVGEAKKARVVEALGAPPLATADGSAIGYVFTPVTGHKGYVALGGPCGLCGEYPTTVRARETLWLKFDAAGTLLRYSTSREEPRTSWEQFVRTAGP